MQRFARSLALLTATSTVIACADDGGLTSTDATTMNETGSENPGDGDGDPGDGDGDPGDGDGDPGDGDPGDGDGDGEGDGDGDSGDGDGDSGDGDGDSGDGDGDGDGDPNAVLRFVALGDAGEGNPSQFAVAAAIEAVCSDKGGCEFALYLGDNFYDDGVSSVDDDQFNSKFELPYADLDMPFWIVMGNHDYGALSFAWEKLAYEVEYTNYSDKWTLPDKWYSLQDYPNVDFFMMDTTRLMWNHETGAQQAWLDDQIEASNKQWKIALAHHPYYSNGEHGNAGGYEGFPFPPQLAGTTVKEVMDESLCDKVDLYLCGHDHNRQWHQQTCGGPERTTHFIVSGAGSKTSGFAYHEDNPVHWENDTIPGFLYVELTLDTIHTEFYDENGVFEFARDISK
jgi:tartrate-resistant acid phosphatase type 5